MERNRAVLAAALVVLWNAAIYFDSSALTAGTVQAADKELRGATMGLHSMCGYAGGFIGPLGAGLVLDWAGNAYGWGLAFGHLALITLTGLFVLRASVHEARCQPWRSVPPSEVTVARCSGAGKRSPRHPLSKQVHRCRSSPPRRRAATSRRTGRA
jgi:MFS family permease